MMHYILLLTASSALAESYETIRVLYVNDVGDIESARAMQAAVHFFGRNEEYSLRINVTSVPADGFVDEEIIPALCKKYNAMVENSSPPHIFIDSTLAGSTSEAMKAFSSSLGLPTISTSFGHDRDLRSWQELNDIQKRYLIQVLPPNDVIHPLIRQLVFRQNMTNAAILFDETVVLNHKFKSIFLNTGISFTFLHVHNETIDEDLKKIHSLFFVNFFVFGTIKTVRKVLETASSLDYLEKKYSWFLLTRDTGTIGIPCDTCSLMLVQPIMSDECRKRLEEIFGSEIQPEVSLSFLFDLYVSSFISIGNILKISNNDLGNFKTCEEYYRDNTPVMRNNIDLLEQLKKEIPIEETCGKITYTKNGFSHMDFKMSLTLINIFDNSVTDSTVVATWIAGLNNTIVTKDRHKLNKYTSYATFRVLVVEDKPFVFEDDKHPSGFNGYSIDLLDELAKKMRFKYTVSSVDDVGHLMPDGNWTGLIGKLMKDEADIGFPLFVTAARDVAIDFTVPIFDVIGINILVKKVPVTNDLFKFINVFDVEVWMCIVVAYFISSVLMWIFTTFPPWYCPSLDENLSQNNYKKRKLRVFNLSECLWFCLTSMTALGGHQAPYKYSSRLVAATWYIFVFIITCTYTANLAAFSTLSRQQSEIKSLSDLSKQYKMQFAPVNGTLEMDYFKNRAYIESKLYQIWEKMSLNDSLSEIERSHLAIFDYPLSNKYSKIWRRMEDSGFPSTLEEAIERVKNSTSSSEGFALMAGSSYLKYITQTNCDLMVVGEDFSLKPLAFGLPNGSPFRKDIDEHITTMFKERISDVLKEKWWANNPEKATCPEEVDTTDGMSIQTMGGVFLLLFSGIFAAYVILGVDYLFLSMNRVSPEKKHKKKSKITNNV